MTFPASRIIRRVSRNKLIALLLPAALLCAPSLCRASSFSFGPAGAYNVVALGYGTIAGTVSDNSDINGRVAADSSVHLASVGQSLVNDPNASLANGYLLVADGGLSSGNHITLQAKGNVYAPGAVKSDFNFNDGGSLVTSGPAPLDFDALRSTLDAESQYLGTLTANGSILSSTDKTFPKGANPSWLVLSGSSTTLNVFDVTSTQLSSVNNPLDIVVPAGSTVVINVSGTSDSLGGAIYINGQQLSETSDGGADILLNFDDASSVQLNGLLTASLLAPFATITGNSSIDGSVFAAAFNDNGEVHNAEFTGVLPGPPAATPEPASLLLLGSALLGGGLLTRRRMLAVRSI